MGTDTRRADSRTRYASGRGRTSTAAGQKGGQGERKRFDQACRNRTVQKITPNLWFDDEAEEAVNRYTSIFDDSSIGAISR